MTIDELLAAAGLTANDEIPIWDAEASGEPTKKITAQNLASAVVVLANLVSGVKGKAESAYRHGNVNLTPANIGLGYSSGNGATSYGTVVYYSYGIVCTVKLNVKEIPNNAWTIIATGLPAAPLNLYFPVRGNTTGALCSVRVTNAGKLEFHGRGTEAACLDSITYVIANS